MAAELENDRRENVRKLAQALDLSAKTVYAALMRTAKLSKKSARWVKKRVSWRWRRSDSGRMRRPKRWRPRSFDSLRQRSHCLRGSRGWRESWPPSFSLRRPPIRTEMGVWEIARRRTSLRRSGGNTSVAWSAWRLLEAVLTKAKNRKCRNSICFFYIAIFRKSSGHTSYIPWLYCPLPPTPTATKVPSAAVCKQKIPPPPTRWLGTGKLFSLCDEMSSSPPL